MPSVPTPDLVLLGLLMERPLHGYELKRLVEERMSQVAHIAPGTIYYTLKKLERQGLVVHEVERAGNRPERQVYAVTTKGREVFRGLLHDAVWADERPYFLFDAALYFYDHVDKQDLALALAKKLAGIERFNEQIDALEEAYPGQWPFPLEALKQKAHLMSDALETWYRDLAQGLESRAQKKPQREATSSSAQSPKKKQKKRAGGTR